MMLKTVSTVTLAMLGATLLALPVAAQETGFANIHTWRKEGKRTCLADHWHYGSSSGEKTKKAAEKAAIDSWSSFTDFEYGSNWARYSRAASKSMKCTQTSGWSCNVEARPCR